MFCRIYVILFLNVKFNITKPLLLMFCDHINPMLTCMREYIMICYDFVNNCLISYSDPFHTGSLWLPVEYKKSTVTYLFSFFLIRQCQRNTVRKKSNARKNPLLRMWPRVHFTFQVQNQDKSHTYKLSMVWLINIQC